MSNTSLTNRADARPVELSATAALALAQTRLGSALAREHYLLDEGLIALAAEAVYDRRLHELAATLALDAYRTEGRPRVRFAGADGQAIEGVFLGVDRRDRVVIRRDDGRLDRRATTYLDGACEAEFDLQVIG